MLEVGTQFGGYQILGPLGSGGMGAVYRARDPRLGREVALKLLLPEFTGDAGRLKRFQREAQLLAGLDHPGIVTIFSVEVAGDVHFLTMQLVEGHTLEELIPAGGLPLPTVLEIAVPLAEAVDAAHRRGVIHRDLKPSNVMRARDGRIKVLDFGLARSVTRHRDVTRTISEAGQIVGTVPYMSPEQLSGMPLDARTDVFSFGTMLYEMTTGSRPFRGDTPVAMLTAILSERPPSVRHVRPELPAALGRLVDRCLQKTAADRPPSLDEVAGILRTLAPSAAVSTSASGPGGSSSGVKGGASIAVMPFTSLSADPEDHFFADGTCEEIINALGRLPDLKVAARSSSFSFKGQHDDLRIVGEKLGVKTILEGSVRRAGRRLRITAQLVDATSGYHLWSERYDRELDDVFEIQEEIARSIASRLTATLVAGSSEPFVRQGTTDLEAYRLYTQGRTLFDQRTGSGMHRAVPYFREALERDPSYALAWSGLADALVLLEDYQVVPPGSVTEQARDAVRRALELDPTLAEAHSSLGILETLLRDGPAAVEALSRAVALRPGYAHAHNWLSWIQLVLGQRVAALGSARRSVELNPLAPEPLSNLALAEIANGFVDGGRRTARRGVEIQPDFESNAFYEALALYHLGRAADALPVLRRTTVSWAPTSPLGLIGLCHVALGDAREARACIARLEAFGDPAGAGLIHAALCDLDAAFGAFDRVERWEYWGTIAMHNLFGAVLAPVHRDGRYAAVQRAINASWQVPSPIDRGG